MPGAGCHREPRSVACTKAKQNHEREQYEIVKGAPKRTIHTKVVRLGGIARDREVRRRRARARLSVVAYVRLVLVPRAWLSNLMRLSMSASVGVVAQERKEGGRSRI